MDAILLNKAMIELRRLWRGARCFPAPLLLGAASLVAPCPGHSETPADKVDTLIGTTGPAGADYGGVCPWVTPPHGMTHWTPMTQENEISRMPYRHDQRKIIGFMGSHQPTVWMGDYGFLTLMPEVGELQVRPEERACDIVPGSEVARPYYYSVQIGSNENRMRVEMTAAERCALFRLSYPESTNCHLFFEMSRVPGCEGWIKISSDHREILGYNSGRHNVYRGRPMGPELSKFRGYFVIQFERPLASFATWDDSAAAGGRSTVPEISLGKDEQTGVRVGAFATFPTAKHAPIKVRIGSSFISLEQARQNLQREVPDWNFDRLASGVRQTWNKYLSRIEIEGGTPDEQTIFYTAMYHALLFPRRFDESGRYYSAFDEKIHSGISYNDYSMWDTFRALHPLLTLIDPEEVEPMIRSLVQMYAEGGWIPKWPNPTFSNIMIGTPADAIIADAFAKGFRNYDLEQAYAALYKDAMTPPEGDEHKRWEDRAAWSSYEARAGLTYYKRLGYVPADKTSESVSCTLEYAWEDFCVAQVARGLGKEADYRFFMERSKNYRNVFNPASGMMQARLSDGRFFEGNPAKYKAFTEGSPWTYLFCVPQDVPGLIDIMGREAFISKLDDNFSGGHYAYDNEPENHYPYLYAWVNQPWKTQKILTEAMRKNYRDTPDGITGNDDCGQMSAWYIFTALGFYPVCPASGVYALGRPFFPKAVLHLDYPKKHTFTIVARNSGPDHIYARSAKLDGRLLSTPFLNHSDLFDHKTLTFDMSLTPGGQTTH
jgi:predicted alpha-1,2-mannosidase